MINWLSSHEDPALQRMAVAVISILVAKVKTLLAYYALVCCRKMIRHLLDLTHSSPARCAPAPMWHYSSFMLSFSGMEVVLLLLWHLESLNS